MMHPRQLFKCRVKMHAPSCSWLLLQDAACEAWCKVWSTLERESPDMTPMMSSALIVSVSVCRTAYAALRREFPDATFHTPMGAPWYLLTVITPHDIEQGRALSDL